MSLAPISFPAARRRLHVAGAGLPLAALLLVMLLGLLHGLIAP
jgi:hypothetical protein